MNAYPRGLPFNAPALWNRKSSLVTFPNLENTWSSEYLSEEVVSLTKLGLH